MPASIDPFSALGESLTSEELELAAGGIFFIFPLRPWFPPIYRLLF